MSPQLIAYLHFVPKLDPFSKSGSVKEISVLTLVPLRTNHGSGRIDELVSFQEGFDVRGGKVVGQSGVVERVVGTLRVGGVNQNKVRLLAIRCRDWFELQKSC